jgi:hypothetical protein
MDSNVTIFNKQNMLSILGIEINDDFDVEFFREDSYDHMTSSLSVTGKEKQSYGIFINNLETINKISSVIEFEPMLSSDGVVTTFVLMNNPRIKSALYLINQYIKVFMAIYTVDEFNKYDSFMLKLILDYNKDLEIINVTSTTDLFKFYSWHHDLIEIEIESYVNNLLNQVGIHSLNEESDIEQAIELLKMQEMVYEMDLI